MAPQLVESQLVGPELGKSLKTVNGQFTLYPPTPVAVDQEKQQLRHPEPAAEGKLSG